MIGPWLSKNQENKTILAIEEARIDLQEDDAETLTDRARCTEEAEGPVTV